MYAAVAMHVVYGHSIFPSSSAALTLVLLQCLMALMSELVQTRRRL